MTESSPLTGTDQLRAHIAGQGDQIKADLTTAMSFDSVFGTNNDSCAASAAWVQQAFTEVGVADVHSVETVDGSIPLFGFTPPADGCPTVLLYCHHDVQPADDQPGWNSNPWELTEKDGRWYGRGTADDKGNMVAHLAALRALRDWAPQSDHPAHPFGGIGIRLVVEGSEEAGGEGLETLVAERPELFAADAILIADTGNVAVGVPTINISLRGVVTLKVTVKTLRSPIHSGQYGGPAPDALYALIHILASLRNTEGGLTIDGLDANQWWEGVQYSPAEFAADAGVLEGVHLSTAGTPSELAWARPTLTVTGIDAASTAHAINAVPAEAAAMLNLRVPPTMDTREAEEKLIAHLQNHRPWNAQVECEPLGTGEPYMADTSGSAHVKMQQALAAAYGVQADEVALSADGGSIPLCAALKAAHPTTQLVLFGVEEPICGIHGPNESVDPTEITAIATAEALFLANFR